MSGLAHVTSHPVKRKTGNPNWHKGPDGRGKSGNPAGGKPGVKRRSHKPSARVINAAIDEARKRLKRPDLSPLDFMLDVLRNPDAFPFAAQQWAAEKAIPYTNKRMPFAIEGGDPAKPLVFEASLSNMTDDQLAKLATALKKAGIDLD